MTISTQTWLVFAPVILALAGTGLAALLARLADARISRKPWR